MISKDEFVDALIYPHGRATAAKAFTDDEAAALFDKVDKDGSGLVNYEEFVSGWANALKKSDSKGVKTVKITKQVQAMAKKVKKATERMYAGVEKDSGVEVEPFPNWEVVQAIQQNAVGTLWHFKVNIGVPPGAVTIGSSQRFLILRVMDGHKGIVLENIEELAITAGFFTNVYVIKKREAGAVVSVQPSEAMQDIADKVRAHAERMYANVPTGIMARVKAFPKYAMTAALKQEAVERETAAEQSKGITSNANDNFKANITGKDDGTHYFFKMNIGVAKGSVTAGGASRFIILRVFCEPNEEPVLEHLEELNITIGHTAPIHPIAKGPPPLPPQTGGVFPHTFVGVDQQKVQLLCDIVEDDAFKMKYPPPPPGNEVTFDIPPPFKEFTAVDAVKTEFVAKEDLAYTTKDEYQAFQVYYVKVRTAPPMVLFGTEVPAEFMMLCIYKEITNNREVSLKGVVPEVERDEAAAAFPIVEEEAEEGPPVLTLMQYSGKGATTLAQFPKGAKLTELEKLLRWGTVDGGFQFDTGFVYKVGKSVMEMPPPPHINNGNDKTYSVIWKNKTMHVDGDDGESGTGAEFTDNWNKFFMAATMGTYFRTAVITSMKCTGVPNRDDKGLVVQSYGPQGHVTSDPYLKLTAVGFHHETPTMTNTANPVWTKEIKFTVEKKGKQCIFFELFDDDGTPGSQNSPLLGMPPDEKLATGKLMLPETYLQSKSSAPFKFTVSLEGAATDLPCVPLEVEMKIE